MAFIDENRPPATESRSRDRRPQAYRRGPYLPFMAAWAATLWFLAAALATFFSDLATFASALVVAVDAMAGAARTPSAAKEAMSARFMESVLRKSSRLS